MRTAIIILACLIATTGCRSQRQIGPPANLPPVVEHGSRIGISILGGPYGKLTGVYEVKSDGTIHLGEVGRIAIGGINVDFAAERIYEALRKKGEVRRVRLDMDVEQSGAAYRP